MSTETGRGRRRAKPADPCLDRAVLGRLSPDEADRALGRKLADEINFALAVAAAEPERRFRRGSLAGRIKKVYRKHRKLICKGSRARAQALLRLPKAQREHRFGSFARADDDALSHRRARANPALVGLVDRAVRGRIQELVSKGSLAGQISDAFFGPVRTTVEAVRGLGGDLPQVLGREVSMVGTPDRIGFRWVTSEPEAEELRWQLFELGSTLPIASGAEGTAPHGTFFIDFKDHLPPKAGKTPRRYVLRCQPWVRSKTIQGSGSSPGATSKVKVPPRPAGAPAPIIRIVYSTDESSTDFDFAEVYRNLDLYMDSIVMIQDQDGPGSEEFVITGLVQDILGTGGQESVGPLLPLRTKSKTLPPVEGAIRRFRDLREHRYHLNNPDAPVVDHDWWPRAYVVTITIWEEDGGDEVASFVSELSSTLNDYLENDWADAVLDALEWLGIELTPVQVNQLTALLYAASAGTILGVVTAAVGFVLAAVVADLADDYYGTKSAILPLKSSESEAIHALTIGGEAGSPLEDGDWRLPTQVLEFKGEPGAISAAAFDGIVEIYLHWEASGREVLV